MPTMTVATPTGEHDRLRRRVGRLVGGWPIWLHRVGLGRLVGQRYAVVSSIGRRTGLARRAAVMVLREDALTGEVFVVAGDTEANWYRNVCVAPAVEVWLAGRRFRPEQRILSTEQIAELLSAIRREHPREARIQAAFFGWPWPATPAQLQSIAASLGGVAFRPEVAAADAGPGLEHRRSEIHFFEEYPTEANLQRARLIGFPASVFLAAETWPDFERARALLNGINPMLTAGWWPVPTVSRALSVFSEVTELAALRRALAAAPRGKILLDLELPIWAPHRLLRTPRSLSRSREELDRLFSTALGRHDVWTAEWPPAAPDAVLRWLRITLPRATTRVYMLYSSTMPRRWRRFLLNRLRPRFESQSAGIAVGVLATGIAGDEPILSLARFQQDLQEAVRLGAATVVIYRLGGLEQRHVRVIEKVLGPRLSEPRRAA